MLHSANVFMTTQNKAGTRLLILGSRYTEKSRRPQCLSLWVKAQPFVLSLSRLLQGYKTQHRIFRFACEKLKANSQVCSSPLSKPSTSFHDVPSSWFLPHLRCVIWDDSQLFCQQSRPLRSLSAERHRAQTLPPEQGSNTSPDTMEPWACFPVGKMGAVIMISYTLWENTAQHFAHTVSGHSDLSITGVVNGSHTKQNKTRNVQKGLEQTHLQFLYYQQITGIIIISFAIPTFYSNQESLYNVLSRYLSEKFGLKVVWDQCRESSLSEWVGLSSGYVLSHLLLVKAASFLKV